MKKLNDLQELKLQFFFEMKKNAMPMYAIKNCFNELVDFLELDIENMKDNNQKKLINKNIKED
jgi:hypothetical protein